MNLKHAQIAAALALAFALVSCGGQSSKPAAMAPSSQPDQCRERSMSGASDSGDAATSAAESSGDYDYDDSCFTGETTAAPLADERQEITQLWNEIREMRITAGMPADPLASDSSTVQPLSVTEIQAQEEHPDPQTQLCIDTCKIEKSICKNATRICRLADNLGGNEWAAEMCNSGKASCQEATKKCATCVAAESTAVSP